MEGNQMKMREALVQVRSAAHSYINAYDDEIDRIMSKIVAICDCALSEPPRNCDLANPEKRYIEFCSRYLSCSTCPHDMTINGLRCDGKWLLAAATKGDAE